MEHQELVGRAVVTGRQRAANEVSIIANHVAAESVPPVRHRRQRRPTIGVRIIAQVFGEGVIGRQFTAEHQNHAVIIGAGEPAARRQQRRGGGLAVGGRIVVVVLGDALLRTAGAPADVADFAGNRDHYHMVAGERQRRRFAPGAGLRIVGFMRRHNLAV